MVTHLGGLWEERSRSHRSGRYTEHNVHAAQSTSSKEAFSKLNGQISPFNPQESSHHVVGGLVSMQMLGALWRLIGGRGAEKEHLVCQPVVVACSWNINTPKKTPLTRAECVLLNTGTFHWPRLVSVFLSGPVLEHRGVARRNPSKGARLSSA